MMKHENKEVQNTNRTKFLFKFNGEDIPLLSEITLIKEKKTFLAMENNELELIRSKEDKTFGNSKTLMSLFKDQKNPLVEDLLIFLPFKYEETTSEGFVYSTLLPTEGEEFHKDFTIGENNFSRGQTIEFFEALSLIWEGDYFLQKYHFKRMFLKESDNNSEIEGSLSYKLEKMSLDKLFSNKGYFVNNLNNVSRYLNIMYIGDNRLRVFSSQYLKAFENVTNNEKIIEGLVKQNKDEHLLIVGNAIEGTSKHSETSYRSKRSMLHTGMVVNTDSSGFIENTDFKVLGNLDTALLISSQFSNISLTILSNESASLINGGYLAKVNK